MLQNLFQLPPLPTPLLKLLLLFQTEGLSFSQGVFVKFGKNPVPGCATPSWVLSVCTHDCIQWAELREGICSRLLSAMGSAME